MAFNGYLVKVVNPNNTLTEIPLTFMRAETYKVTPQQRLEWSAERDVTGVLHRETVQNMPPKIEFKTPIMTNSMIKQLNTIFQSAYTNVPERKLTVEYYDPASDSYKRHDCYMPDVDYVPLKVDSAKSVIWYNETRYALIGY